MSAAPALPSLWSFSAYITPPKGHLMGTLKGYLDDSGDEPDPYCNCVVYAGYVAEIDEWENLEARWIRALEEAEVPYLHMNELIQFSPPYEKWRRTPGKREKFLLHLAEVAGSCNLTAVAAAVDKKALKDFNERKDFGIRNALDAEAIAIYLCNWILQEEFGSSVIELEIDKVSKPTRLKQLVENISDHEWRDVPTKDQIQNRFIFKSRSSKDIPSMQLADFLAWETRRFNSHRITNGGAIDESQTRPTFAALRRAHPFHGIFLNDNGLNAWDNGKGGAWPNTWQGKNVITLRRMYQKILGRPV